MSYKDFLVNDGVLKKYLGNEKIIHVPYGIRAVDEKAFENSDVEEIYFEQPTISEDNLIGFVVEKSLPVYFKEGAFKNCANLKKIVFPERVSVLGGGVFSGCTKLKEIMIPNFISEIKEYTFWSCRSLEAVYLPDTIKIIKNCAFKDCPSLKDVYLPSSTYLDGFSFDAERLTEIKFHYKIKERK